MSLPEQLLLSDLLRRRVRCDQGLDHGAGSEAWMHPPVHRLLGWISRPSAFGDRRCAWRLDQLRGLAEQELYVQGAPADTDQATVDRLPTLIGAALIGRAGDTVGRVVDAAVDLDSGRIAHYLVARSDPRLPGTSRWRLSPDRITDQQPGQVITAIEGLDDLPLARASVRQEFLRRSRRWRDQMQEETFRLRDQFQQAGDRFEDRLEGWLEEPPWDPLQRDEDRFEDRPPAWEAGAEPEPEAWDDWLEEDPRGRPPADIRGYPADEVPTRHSPTRRPDRAPVHDRLRDDPDQDPWF
ncbi:MAG: RNA methyltransferase [Vulcanococcus sp.]